MQRPMKKYSDKLTTREAIMAQKNHLKTNNTNGR